MLHEQKVYNIILDYRHLCLGLLSERNHCSAATEGEDMYGLRELRQVTQVTSCPEVDERRRLEY
jgi:hypothetical protein